MKPVIGMILSLGLITLAAEIPAAFKDPGLEQNIRKFIHGADPSKPLTQDQLNHVYLVSASNQSIRDLAGLEKCPNLNTVYLSWIAGLRPHSAEQADQPRAAHDFGWPDPGPDAFSRSHAPALSGPVAESNLRSDAAGQPEGSAVAESFKQRDRATGSAARLDRAPVSVPGRQSGQRPQAAGRAQDAADVEHQTEPRDRSEPAHQSEGLARPVPGS